MQSQLYNDGEIYDYEADQIQISAGSCDAEEFSDKIHPSKYRHGPHEGIKNKNYAMTD